MPQLNILIVDDKKDKSERVVTLLGSMLKEFGPIFSLAQDYEGAMEALQRQFFDFVVLDLLIPGANQKPSKVYSRSLINQLVDGRLVPATFVVGLTEYNDAAVDEKTFFDENLLTLEVFSWSENTWAERLAKRFSYLIRSKRSAHKFQINNHDLDVFIVVARHETEFNPIKEILFGSDEQKSATLPHWNIEACFGQIDLGAGRKVTACLAYVAEMGVAPTSAVVAQAVALFRPRLVAMLGMCCGFSGHKAAYPQSIGNVIVVREVTCWEEGKFLPGSSSDEFRSRSKTRPISDQLRRPVEIAVEKSAESIMPALNRWRKRKSQQEIIRKYSPLLDMEPKVRFGALVTGSSFVANAKKISEIIDLHNTALGLDMEVFALYTAPEFVVGSKPLCLAIKGVADYGDGNDCEELQVYASSSSAIVFKEILSSIDLFSLKP